MDKKALKGFESEYEIYEDGRIFSLKKNIFIKPYLHHSGYFRMTICRDRKKYYRIRARLIAVNFVPNPENKKEVNHINGIKTDDRIENLEWVSGKENSIHRVEKLNKHNRKPVSQFNMNWEYIKTFPSIWHAGKELGITAGNICTFISGKKKLKHIGNFKWKYA